MSQLAVSAADIADAARRIAPWAHRTPVMTCRTINAVAGCEVFFKCEMFQKVGAFKFRGAANAVLKLSDADAARGVVTHSSGNHAQALALAARMRGIPAHVVMPRTASPVKRQAVEEYGAHVVECEPTLEARESTVERIRAETGAVLIPPFNHVDVIAGQGTATRELLEEVPTLDAVIAPIGGGGLISGMCIAAKAHPGPNPVRCFAAEPAGADDAARSLAAGTFVPQTNPKTVADGLLTSMGPLTWAVVHSHIEQIITPDDLATIDAMRMLWERAKLMAEPSSAVALAAVLHPEFRKLDGIHRVGVILSGGNVSLDCLPWQWA